MNVTEIREALKGFPVVEVEKYVEYLQYLANEKDRKTETLKNAWMKRRPDKFLIDSFINVHESGLVFDGQHITLQKTGVTFDYQAYKNKMFLAYPETIIDDDLVYEKDVFEFKKESGRVYYTHDIIDPFSRTDDAIIGGYCVIRNKRGEFLTLLSRSDIEKHRKVAKTDYIWKSWFKEMCRKTVLKKACKKHFEDIYQHIINADNEAENDIDNDVNIDLSVKQKVEQINDLESLKNFYFENKDKHTANLKGFNNMISKRKEEIENENS